jgi:hypothetical protein
MSEPGKRIEIIAAILTILTVLWYLLRPKDNPVADGVFITPAGTVSTDPAVLFSGGGIPPTFITTFNSSIDTAAKTGAALAATTTAAAENVAGTVIPGTALANLMSNLPPRSNAVTAQAPRGTQVSSGCVPKLPSSNFPDGMGACMAASPAGTASAKNPCTESVQSAALENMLSIKQYYGYDSLAPLVASVQSQAALSGNIFETDPNALPWRTQFGAN